MASFTPSGVEFVARGLSGYLSDLARADKAQQDLGRSAQGLNTQFSGGVSAVQNLGSAASSSGGMLSSLGSTVVDLGVKTAALAAGGIALLGSALVAVGVSGTKAFIELEQGFANLEAISGDTKAQLEPLKGLITDLALDPNLKVSTTEATDALYALTKQGLEVDEIMSGAGRATVELANATGADFTPAAEIAAGVMKAWNIEASNMSMVADGMTGVLTNSKFKVDDYNLAFSQSGAVFSNLGGSLTDFNTIIAGTSGIFASGSDAGTSFKNLIMSMSAPTKEAQIEMQKYGISIFNADGTMKDWSEVAGQLNKVLYGTIEVTSTVGGVTEEQAAAAEKASANIGDLTRDIGQQEAKLQLMNDVYQESLKFYDAGEPKMRNQALAIQNLTNNIQDQKEKLGSYQQAIAAVDGVQAQTITSTKQLTEAERAKLAETIAGRDSSRLLLELGKMTSEQYDELSDKVNKSGQALDAASIRMDTTAGALDILKGIIEAVQLQIGEKFTPMVKTAAQAMSMWVSENSGDIIDFFGSIATGIEDTVAGVTKVIGAFDKFGIRGASTSILGQLGFSQDAISEVNGVIATITEAFNKISQAYDNFGARGAATSILGQLGMSPEMIGTIRTAIDTIVQDIGILQTVFSQFGAQGAGVSLLSMLGLSSESIGLITTGIQTVMDSFAALSDWWTTNWPVMQAVAMTAWEVLQGIFAGITTALGPVLSQLQTQFGEIFTQLGQTLAGLGISWSDVWNSIVTATQVVAVVIGAVILGIIGVIAGLATGVASGISATIGLFQSLSDNVSGIITGLITMFSGWVITINALLSGDFAGAWEGFKVTLQGAYTFWTNMWSGMLEAVLGVIGIIASTIGGFAQGVIGFFQGMYDELIGNSIIPDLINGIVKWFKDLPQKIFNALGDLKTKVTAPFADIGRIVREEVMPVLSDFIDDVIPALGKGIEYVTEGVKNFISSIREAASTLADMVVPDWLQMHSPPPLAQALTMSADAASRATKGLANMQRQMITSSGAAHDFVDSLDMGGIATELGGHGTAWKNWRRILKQNIGANMGALAEGMSPGEILGQVGNVAAQWRLPPGVVTDLAQANGLVEHLTDTFAVFERQMRIENLGNMTQMAGSFSSLGSSFADMLTNMMAGGEAAKKTATDYRKLSDELAQLTTTENGNQIAIDKKKLAIEKMTEALGFNQRQLDIYNEELAGLTPDTLAWDKKKLAIDKLTETMDAENKQLVTLQQELDKLESANERDTAAIEKKRAALEELTKGYQKLQAEAFDLFSGNQNEGQRIESELATIALLQDFLASGAESFLIPADAVSQAAGITGILYDQISGQQELNRLLAEQAEREELITRQKEAQQKLDFLKSQLDLIKLGESLGGDIFQGITFGLNASVEDLLAATNAVVEAMVGQIDADLQLGSPSRLMMSMFGDAMAGATLGVQKGAGALEYAFNASLSPFLNAGKMLAPSTNSYGNTNNNYFNMNVNTGANASAVIRQYEVARSTL